MFHTSAFCLFYHILASSCVRGEQVLSCKEPGGLFATCELGNGALCAPFQGSRADAKQMRGKRSSAVSTAREGGLPSEGLPRRQDGGVVKHDDATEGVTSSLQGKFRQPLLRRGRALMPAAPLPKKSLLRQIFFGSPKGGGAPKGRKESLYYSLPCVRGGGLPSEGLPRRQDGGVVKHDDATEGAIPHIRQNNKS